MNTIQHEHETDKGTWRVEIEYYFVPPEKGVHTFRNGDPGYPDTPGYVDDFSYRVISFIDNEKNAVAGNDMLSKEFEAIVNADENLKATIEEQAYAEAEEKIANEQAEKQEYYAEQAKEAIRQILS